MRISRLTLVMAALAVVCFAAALPIDAQSRDKTATVTLVIEGMT